MNGIDSLLKMLLQSSGDELRIAADQAPKMTQRGRPLRLSIPETSAETVRHLCQPMLSDDREAQLARNEPVRFVHRLASGESFTATLSMGAKGLQAAFILLAGKSEPVAPPETSSSASPSTLASQVSAPPTSTITPILASVPFPPAAPTVPTDSTSFGTPSHPALHALLNKARARRASDVHLANGETPVFRIDGALVQGSAEHLDVEALFQDQLGESVRSSLRAGHSIDSAFALEQGRFRLNLFRAAGGLAAAIRILPTSAPALADLNLPIPLHDLAALPHGLVIVCGPTGSGKSATLAALAQEAIRKRGGNLITLEDPIEYAFSAGPGSLVRQRQIGREVANFPTGLRDALREDPDILLIGEMRDPETIALAITAAETGHLVLTSLHSRSASSAIDRIIDSLPHERERQARVLLADTLKAVIAQRLIPQLRGEGRLPAVEVLRGTTNVAALIRDGKNSQLPSAIQSGRKEGMLPLEACLAQMVRTGHISREQAMANASDALALEGYLHGAK